MGEQYNESDDAFLILAMSAGLPSYVRKKLRQTTSMGKKHQGRPRLDWALRPRWRPSNDFAIEESSPDYETTALVLSQGADPNEPFSKSTVWGRFLLLLHENKSAGKDSRMSLETTRLLIEYGASATIDWQHHSHTPLKGDPYQRKNYMRPSDIIEECFPADAEKRNALFRQQRRQERVGAEASVTKSTAYPIRKNDEKSTRSIVTPEEIESLRQQC